MNGRIAFGIVGGYGATGREVVSELARSGDHRIVIGGRDLAKANAMAREFDGRVSAKQLDVMNAQSLDAFCSQCFIIINCAGPVTRLQDRVAQAAFRQHCHYVDPAGMSFVAERMRDKNQQIKDSGLSFVVSAGWMPGVTEAMMIRAHAQAMQQMDRVESLTVYYGDCGEWSDNALLDGVWYIRQLGLRNPDYFQKGQRTRASRSEVLSTVNLGSPIGRRRFGLIFTPEMKEIGSQLSDCDVWAYSYVSGFRTIFTSVLIASLPMPESLSLHLLRNVFRRNRRLPVGGFAVAQALGRSQTHQLAVTTQAIYERGRDYRINGLAVATVARMIAEANGVQKGVHFLTGAVDSGIFLQRLRAAGVEQTESIEARPSRRS